MNVLGMGPMELLLILILALIVFGPDKLPEMMRQVGKAVNDFRKATSELTDEFNRTIQAEVEQTRAAVEGTPPAAPASPAPPLTATPTPVADPAPRQNGTADVAPPPADAGQGWYWEGAEPSAAAGASAEKRGADDDLLPPY